MTGFGNKKSQKLDLTLSDVRWVYSPEHHETRGKRLDEIIGDALVQWIHTGEVWLITDGKKPVMVCHVSSIMSEQEAVMIRVKMLNKETLTQIQNRMSHGIVLTRFEILRFDAQTSDISFIFTLQNQKEARQRATSSFDIIFLAMGPIADFPSTVSFVDIGSKTDQLFEHASANNQKKLNDVVFKLGNLSDQWCAQFDGDQYIDRYRERVSKPIVIPTQWDEL